MCVSPQNSHGEILTPNVRISGGWGLWEVIMSWAWSPRERDLCPCRKRHRRACFLSLCFVLWEAAMRRKAICNPGWGGGTLAGSTLIRNQIGQHLHLDLLTSRTVWNKCLFQPPSLWYFATAAELTKIGNNNSFCLIWLLRGLSS